MCKTIMLIITNDIYLIYIAYIVLIQVYLKPYLCIPMILTQSVCLHNFLLANKLYAY